MAVFIDPPLWPAHGTVFSHVISDHSIEELHRFITGTPVSRRAFDQDHYDVPAALYDSMVRAGAVPVSAGELTRRLRSSGLRVPARERTAKIRPQLLTRWERLLPARPGLGRDLLGRWEEPHRRYHTSVHLLEVLDRLDALHDAADAGALGETEWTALRLAAWFHDAVYRGAPGQDERDSAELCERMVGGLLPEEVTRLTVRLILRTAEHMGRDEAEDLAPSPERGDAVAHPGSPDPGSTSGSTTSSEPLPEAGTWRSFKTRISGSSRPSRPAMTVTRGRSARSTPTWRRTTSGAAGRRCSGD